MDQSEAGDGGTFGINRRNVLKVLGGTAVAAGAMTGTASAHESQFFGCSQVCTNTDANKAVVHVDGSYECRPLEIETQSSNRNNVAWGYRYSACYEVADGESIVGVLHIDEETGCTFCVNPNRCAENYYDSVQDIVDDVKGCVGACESIAVGGSDCTVYSSNGSTPNGTDNPNANEHARGHGS